jgi:hypothetical protein
VQPQGQDGIFDSIDQLLFQASDVSPFHDLSISSRPGIGATGTVQRWIVNQVADRCTCSMRVDTKINIGSASSAASL